MERRLVLCDFYWTRDKDPRVPLGHASLLAALKEKTSVEARSVVIAVNLARVNVQAVVEEILEHTKGLPPEKVDVAIGCYVWAEHIIQEVLCLLRAEGFEGRIILGGPQISYAQRGLQRLYPHADVFIRGYGEDALCRLVKTSGCPSIRGVHYAWSHDLCEQAEVDLLALPSPFLTGVVPLRGQKFIRWETQRGCPFRCSFCQHKEAGARLALRELSMSRVIKEIDLFCEAGVEDIAVLDPIFNASPTATGILERFVERGFTGRLSLQCRAEQITPAFLNAAEKLHVSLEFGLQTIHDNESKAIKRHNNIKKVEEVLNDVKRRGLNFEVSLIFGLPEQTLASFQETIRWCLKRKVPIIKAFPLMLLRGTELEQERHRWNLIEEGEPMPIVVESNHFTREDWYMMAQISEALRLTERRHPNTLEELLQLALHTEPEFTRWRPSKKAA